MFAGNIFDLGAPGVRFRLESSAQIFRFVIQLVDIYDEDCIDTNVILKLSFVIMMIMDFF